MRKLLFLLIVMLFHVNSFSQSNDDSDMIFYSNYIEKFDIVAGKIVKTGSARVNSTLTVSSRYGIYLDNVHLGTVMDFTTTSDGKTQTIIAVINNRYYAEFVVLFLVDIKTAKIETFGFVIDDEYMQMHTITKSSVL